MSQKYKKLIKDNLVLIVCLPLIVGVHYGWMKLQEVPYLVDQKTRRELPIVEAVKAYKQRYFGSKETKNED